MSIGGGLRVLSFRKKRKNQRKADFVCLPQAILVRTFFRELYTGSCPAFLRCLFRPEPAAFALPLFAAHASYNLYSFRDSANGVFLFRQVAPAPCSPPLGGSDENSAVRFTPAVKYGGRENWLSRRATRCIRSHPCRAHHKLKWARTEQSVLGVLYELFPRSESSNEINAQSRAVIRLKASPERTGLPRERWSGFRPHFQLLQASKTHLSPSAPASVSGEPNKSSRPK